MSSMFCYQCEQTSQATGCTAFGVCGKEPEVAALQDLLIHATKGISRHAHRAALLGKRDDEIDQFVLQALFTTVTNVNFDPSRMRQLIDQAFEHIQRARSLYQEACTLKGAAPESYNGASTWEAAASYDEIVRQGEAVSIERRSEETNEDVLALQELITYGLKGMAAYAWHARILGQKDEAVTDFIHEALDHLASGECTVETLLPLALRTGEVNLRVLELLDTANTSTYGHPVPTPVRLHPLKGKAILVSGHELKDLELLLRQTEGKGLHIYTHGEMLPAHGYPELKKFSHFAGHYGTAWQNQSQDFDAFPGSILMTTNCIQKPKSSYAERIFTTGLVAWPGVQHVENSDFGPLIEKALACEGFTEDGPADTITVGFAHNAVMQVADKVIDAVKGGAVRHFFLIGGCDGAKTGRNYYTEFADSVPQDCAILTLGCGKFRFHDHDFGDIGGIPRLLDCGQCNDAYSAIQIAVALSRAFDCSVNDLPLSMIISWYEQKAVCILLTLLHLGIKDIRLGPSLPAFVTPNVAKVLSEKFNLMPITSVEQDLKACLA